MAENKLVIDLLSQRLVQSETAVRAFHDASVFCYNNFLGLPSARASLAYFIAKHIMVSDEARRIDVRSPPLRTISIPSSET